MENKEIFSSCCAFGGGCEEVHVLRSECPIDRQVGLRQVELIGESENREECTCIYKSAFGGGIPACKHYEGFKKVTRNKKEKYKVFCSALNK